MAMVSEAEAGEAGVSPRGFVISFGLHVSSDRIDNLVTSLLPLGTFHRSGNRECTLVVEREKKLEELNALLSRWEGYGWAKSRPLSY